MATADIIDNMDGIGTNPGLLIRAPDYAVQGAEIVYNDAYFEGKAVRGSVRGQKIMETPWLAAGTLNNVVIPMVYMEGATGVTGTGTSADRYNDKLKITVFKRLPSQPQTITSKEIYVSYVDNISNKIGMAPHAEHLYRPSWNPTWFDIRYEYKFAVEVFILTTGAALDVEGIYLQYYITNSVMSGRQVQYGSQSMAQAIPVVAGCYWKATTDASGNIGCTLTSEYFPYSSGFTLGESGSGARPTAFADELGLKPIINSVDAVVTCLAGGTDIDAEWLIWNYEEVDSSNGGFTIYVGLHSDNASVVYTFETFVFGYCTPMVI